MSVPALHLECVYKRFGTVDIVRGVTLKVPSCQRWAIIGPNGAGKSLLLNLISGLSDVSGGTIHLHGQKINGMQAWEINRCGLSRSFQITSIFPRLNVYQNLQCAVLWSLGYRYCFWRRLSALNDVRCRVEQVLEQIRLTDRRAVAAAHLTYAEQRALELGIAIAGDAKLILLDEPTAGMSRSEASSATDLIGRATAGRTLLMVEHDMDVVFDLADCVVVMVQGKVIACDTPANIRNDPLVQEAYLGNL